MTDTTHAVLFSDGSALPTNPGHGGAGFVLLQNGTIIASGGSYLGYPVSNNVAEYAGLIHGLESARALGIESIEAFADSKLVVEQTCDRWKVKAPHLRAYRDRVRGLLRQFTSWTLEWTPRANNAEADKFANSAAVLQHDVGPGELVDPSAYERPVVHRPRHFRKSWRKSKKRHLSHRQRELSTLIAAQRRDMRRDQQMPLRTR